MSEGGSDVRGEVHAVQRRLIGKHELLVGCCAGAATVLGCALVLLLLGLIPSEASHEFFGVWYAHSLSEWFADAFLAPFWGLTARHPGGGYAPIHSAGLSFGALLVFAATLWAVAWQVRRRVPPTLRQRSGALLVAALVAAASAAVAAAALAHTSPTVEAADVSRVGGPVTYGPLSYFGGAFAATFLVGSFCFGVVGLLPQPWAAALRRAGAFLGVCLLASGLLFPVFVVSDNLPGAKIAEDFGLASRFTAAAGGLGVPLALQASVSLTQWYVVPWVNHNFTSDANWVHWRKLAVSTAYDHPRGHLYQYAASLGVVGSLVGAALTLTVVGALVLISWGLCHGVGARSARRGLSLGFLQGAAIAALLVAMLWLSSYYVRYGDAPADAGIRSGLTYWGITAVGLAQSVASIVLVCGLAGLVYGARQARLADRSSDVQVEGRTHARHYDRQLAPRPQGRPGLHQGAWLDALPERPTSGRPQVRAPATAAKVRLRTGAAEA